jgi:xylulokinase
VSEVFLGIDLGSGSSKGVLCRPDGAVLATCVRSHSMSMPHPGWAEVDPEVVWWPEVTSICTELMARLPAGDRVASVCVSGVGPCLVLCDDRLRPVRPAILYGIDTRATAEIEELTAALGYQALLETCGKALSSQAVGPKMLWVQRHEPEVWAKATGWYNSSSYVAAKLTGEYVLDHHTASQCDPLYDLAARDWSAWAGDIMSPLPAPRLAWPSDVVGHVTTEAATATGLPEGTPVAAGTVDAWAEAFSAGVRGAGDMMLMYGSTMFFVQALGRMRVSEGLWTTAGVEPGTYTSAAGMATSGSVVEWLRGLAGAAPYEQLLPEAAAVPPGSRGLLVLPYFAGERTPVFDPDARGVIAGLSLRHGRGELLRAVYEGTAFAVRHIMELFEANHEPVKRVVAVGGGTQSGLWTQIVSDVGGFDQHVPRVALGASYGDALLGAIGIGAVDAGTDWAQIDAVIHPDPASRAVYEPLYAAYRQLYQSTRDQVHLLAELQRGEPKPATP